jgi:LysM repeat protein
MEIARANGITAPYTIYVGQVLTIPMSNPMPTPMQQHVVQQGETLSSIAAQYGTTWQAIAQLNNIKNPNVIFPGMVLKIPS